MKKSLFFLFLLISGSYCFAQQARYKIDYFAPREYGKGHNAENLGCVQDNNGVLYFGNAGGILQYDGVNWSFIPVKNQSAWIYCLAISSDNVIYVGAPNEFGYLAPDATGNLIYVSLSDQLPDNRKPFLEIVRIWTWENTVAFQYEEALFLYSAGKLTTILPETSFHYSFLLNNELFIRERGKGVMKLTGNKLQFIKGSEYLKDYNITSIVQSYDTSRFVIITYEDGFWSVDKDSFMGSKMDLEDKSILTKSGINGALKLKDGNFALNTSSNGIIITDEKFKIKSVINKDNGLKVNVVNSLIQDFQGNIWAGLDNGIANIHYFSPVTVFGPESGLSGNIEAIERYNGSLFIGTTDGLFFQAGGKNKYGPGKFEQFGNFSGGVKSLCLATNRLLVGTINELSEISGSKINKIRDLEINDLHYSDKLRILLVSAKNYFAIYKYSDRWVKVKEIPEITEEVIRFEESVTDEGTTIWMGTSQQGVVRLKLKNNLDYKIDKYNNDDGLLANDWVYPFKLNNNIVFSQRNGLLTFVELTSADEKRIRDQLPDSLKNRPEFYKGYFDVLVIDHMKEKIRQPFYFIRDTKTRIYVYLDGELGYFDKSDSLTFLYQPFCLTDIGKTNIIYYEDNGICWIGGDDGLIMYDENCPKNYNIDFKTLITKVSCGLMDSIIHYGYSDIAGKINLMQATGKKIVLKYNHNTVTFWVAAPFYEGQGRIKYSYRLSGQDTSFSSWETANRFVFRNLREGDYTFTILAMNAYGHNSTPAEFRFQILSPWYRKFWALIIYFILASAVIYTGVRLYTRRLVAQNKKLENIVAQRTHEIKEKNIELERQKEEIVASITYANRIQNAVLPSEDLIQSWLGDHFIMFRPKDIVSGDFYWTTNYKQYVVFCVADCTGHGVPGAFMSMLCISFLNEIVLKERVMHTDDILNKIRNMIIESLNQRGVMGEQKDGMDISLCIYNKETSELEFSGANNPLYIIRKKDQICIPCDKQKENDDYVLYEIKGDRMPIAIYDRMDPFTKQTLNLVKDDRLYLFSDGICDQFGGAEAKRFKNSSLREALIETITPRIKDQKALLEDRLDKWMSHINTKTGQPYSQIDDICVMGVKIL